MKLSANPLMVAVALGMLGPLALADSDEEATEAMELAEADVPLFQTSEAALDSLEQAWQVVDAMELGEPLDVT